MNGLSLHAEAPAKINLGLWITGRRPDGYHDLLTVFQAVDFCDTLTVDAAPPGRLTLEVSGLPAPGGEDNLVLRAARLLASRAGVEPGAHLRLEKHIPAGAGLGGGSSDAAAALRLLDRLWDLRSPAENLQGLALELGSDVPFFLRGGTALGQGRGERLTPLALPETPWGWVLALPTVESSTAAVFAAFTAPSEPPAMTPETLRALIGAGDLEALGRGLENQLEAAACSLSPELARLGAWLRDRAPRGSVVGLSGSGSAFFILTPTREAAREWVQGLGDGLGPADTPKGGLSWRLCSPLGVD